MKFPGVYQIQSKKKPNKIYIGSALNIYKRWKDHLNGLKINKHSNPKLQAHFNKYGESDLQFSVLVGCPKEDLIKTEQYFLDSYKPWFNICPTAGSQLGLKKSKESRDKMRKSHLGKKLKPFTEEHKRNMSKAKTKEWAEGKRESFAGKNNPFYGKHHSEETMQRIISKTKGKHHSISTEFRKGKPAPNKGRKRVIINNKVRYIA